MFSISLSSPMGWKVYSLLIELRLDTNCGTFARYVAHDEDENKKQSGQIFFCIIHWNLFLFSSTCIFFRVVFFSICGFAVKPREMILFISSTWELIGINCNVNNTRYGWETSVVGSDSSWITNFQFTFIFRYVIDIRK